MTGLHEPCHMQSLAVEYTTLCFLAWRRRGAGGGAHAPSTLLIIQASNSVVVASAYML